MTRFEQQCRKAIEESKAREAERSRLTEELNRKEQEFRAQTEDMLAREHSGEAAE